jgi:hypothetical protein
MGSSSRKIFGAQANFMESRPNALSANHLQEILYPAAFEMVIPVRVNHQSSFGLFLNDEVFLTFTGSIPGGDRDQAGFGPLRDTGNDRAFPGDLYIDCLQSRETNGILVSRSAESPPGNGHFRADFSSFRRETGYGWITGKDEERTAAKKDKKSFFHLRGLQTNGSHIHPSFAFG